MLNNQKEIILLKDLGYLYPTQTSKQKKKFGLYRCYCGETFKAQIQSVKTNHTKSCGCLSIDRLIKFNKDTKITHGLSKHRIYTIWTNMLDRCNNSSHKAYKNYGGIGIKICDEWNNNFISFYNWALNNGYESNLTIDRKDNDKGYSPDNCRWVTQEIQSRNTRRIRENNTSGYRGVSFKKAINKFQCRINVDKKQIYLGVYDSAIEAAKAYDKYILDNNLEHTKNF